LLLLAVAVEAATVAAAVVQVVTGLVLHQQQEPQLQNSLAAAGL
jgi:hypothetical protein